ncbi:hypothetical protein ACFLS9_03880 [Bacteroidota bacterium]
MPFRTYPDLVNQTIKANKELIAKIRRIAHEEERSLVQVTNKLLKNALILYAKEGLKFNVLE